MNRDTDTERSHRFSIHDNLPSFDDVVKSLEIEMVALALQFPTCANMCTYCSMPPCSRNMELDEINAKAEMLDTFDCEETFNSTNDNDKALSRKNRDLKHVHG